MTEVQIGTTQIEESTAEKIKTDGEERHVWKIATELR
jgi:hypothetical protein